MNLSRCFSQGEFSPPDISGVGLSLCTKMSQSICVVLMEALIAQVCWDMFGWCMQMKCYYWPPSCHTVKLHQDWFFTGVIELIYYNPMHIYIFLPTTFTISRKSTNWTFYDMFLNELCDVSRLNCIDGNPRNWPAMQQQKSTKATLTHFFLLLFSISQEVGTIVL